MVTPPTALEATGAPATTLAVAVINAPDAVASDLPEAVPGRMLAAVLTVAAGALELAVAAPTRMLAVAVMT